MPNILRAWRGVRAVVSSLTNGRGRLVLCEVSHQNGIFEFRPNSAAGIPVKPETYEGMKLGGCGDAQVIANAMVAQLIEERKDIAEAASLGMVVSPSKSIRSGAKAIGNRYRAIINNWRIPMGLEPIRLIPSSRHRVGVPDLSGSGYGAFGKAERRRWLNNNQASVNGAVAHCDALVVVDDIITTGGMEEQLAGAIKIHRVPSSRDMYVYAAQMDPEIAKTRPHVEEGLNHVTVRSVKDLRKFREAGGWSPTNLACHVLMTSPPDEALDFYNGLTRRDQNEIIIGILDYGYLGSELFHSNALSIVTAYQARFSKSAESSSLQLGLELLSE